MFAIVGITGNVGGAVAEALLKQGKQVRGIVRNPDKAQAWKERGVELVTADYDQRLEDAFRGTEGIFAMIPPNMAPEPGFPDSIERIAALKKAIVAARPPKAVYLSSIGAEQPHGLGLITAAHVMEQELGNAGVPTAFLRAGSFMENNLHSISAARNTGKYFAFYQPLDKANPLIATDDIGRIGAEVLSEDWQGNRFIEISGPEYYSSNDVADAMSKALGKSVEAVAVPRDTWVAAMAQFGIPSDRSGAYIEMVDSFNSGWIHFDVPRTEHVKGTIDLVTNMHKLVGEHS